jgi:ABC-type lipoprotein release transport system permease subunit
MGTILYGVGALDPLTYAAVALALAAAAVFASWLPARRAARVAPAEALAAE